jgi:uncharacterized membrane protein
MRIIFILGILSALSLPFRVRTFEALIWALLTTPIFGYLLYPMLGLSAPSYLLIMLLSFIGWCFVWRKELDEPAHQDKGELSAVIFFLLAYIVVYIFILQWDQFFPMGERLRDYALLSSVIRSPIVLSDPWFHGYPLNYYAYWYRFGHFLSTVLNLSAPDVYNQLQALTYALYLSAIYRLSTRFLGWSTIGGVFTAIFIGFGSNLEGIFSILQKSDNWWGPSRVIPGAIHEFPVWSFLLGDLHPHYLNLAGIPLLLILFLHVQDNKYSTNNLLIKLFYSGLFLVCGCLFIYNANAWEVPVWGLIVGGISLSWLISRFWGNTELLTSAKPTNWIKIFSSLVLALVISYSLWDSSRNILPNPYPVSIVEGNIPRTSLLEYLRHWGIPTVLVGASLAVSTITPLLAAAIILGALCTLIWPNALILLFIFLILLIWNFTNLLLKTSTPKSNAERTLYVCSIAAIFLCLVPEFIFLNDPYGGENERMNTIFKIYSSSWFLLQFGALFLFRNHLAKSLKSNTLLYYSLMSVTLLISTSFFVHTVKLRKTTTTASPNTYGSLASAQDNFPGSADAIMFLRTQPGMVVLEAQGNAYAWTSLIATLSNKDSFLGWKNHIDLLIRAYDESARRENVTKQFYTSEYCQKRKEILLREKIDYAIVGSLEVKQHPGADTLDYSCLKEVFKKDNYRVFSN